MTMILLLLACSDYDINRKITEPEDGFAKISVTPEVVDFGEVPIGEGRTEVVTISSVGDLSLNVSNIKLEAGFNFSLIDANPMSLLPGESSNFIVSWESDGYEDSDNILISSNDLEHPEIIVPIAGRYPEDTGSVDTGDTGEPVSQPVAVCSVDPSEVEAIHGSADWIGSSSYDPSGDSIVNYDWQLISVPSGSTDSMPAGGANRRNFVPNVVGEYIGQLVVTNSSGVSSEPCYATLNAIPGGDLWIEMFWVNMGDDMDLHLVNPGGTLTTDSDCYYANCTWGGLDWGVRGDTSDNPILDLDDIPGTGPENVNINDPANGIYTIYVHDYPGSVYSGRNDVTVNIYVGGTLEWTDTRNINTENYYEPFCEVDWFSGYGTVSSL
jgi:hypothetical protein